MYMGAIPDDLDGNLVSLIHLLKCYHLPTTICLPRYKIALHTYSYKFRLCVREGL